MKKKIALLLVGVMTLSLTGCAGVAKMVGQAVGEAAKDGEVQVAETASEVETETVMNLETEVETETETETETVEESEMETETEEEMVEKTSHTSGSTITELSDDIYDFQVKIDGDVYQVPMWYSDLEAMGWICEEDDTQTIGSNSYESVKFRNENGVIIQTYIVNLGVNTAPYTDCEIGRIAIEPYDNDDKTVDFELPGGIKVMESTYDDVIAAYGAPTDEYNSDLYDKLTYRLDYYEEVNLFVYKESGVLEKFDVENMIVLEGADTEVSDAEPECVSLYEAPSEISDDPFDYTFEIAGDCYRLPCPVSEFLDNGWKIIESDSAEAIAGYDYDWITLQKDNQKDRFLVRNYDENAVVSQYAFVTSIESGVYSMKLPMTVCGGISIGDDASKIEEFFEGRKCHFEKNDNDSYVSYTAYEGNYSTDKYYFVAREGKIDSIEISFTPDKNELYK